MQFYRALYFSPNIEHRGTVKWRLQHNAGGLALYVITLCDESLTKTGQQEHVSCWPFSAAAAGENAEICSGRSDLETGNQLQFFHSVFLQPEENRKHCPMIIGLAEGRHEAVELVRQIVEETWKADGDYDIVRYLARRDRRIRVPGAANDSGSVKAEEHRRMDS